MYLYVTSSSDIRYDNRSYVAFVQRKSHVFQVVKIPHSRRDCWCCYRHCVRTL